MIKRNLCCIGICLFSLSQVATGSTKYVTDDLQLALHELAGSQGKLIKRLPSGTKLEVLEESGLFAKVRTPDGAEGWTKSGFLMTNKPARARLLELENQLFDLRKTFEQAQTELEISNQQVAELQEAESQARRELAEQKQGLETSSQLIADLRKKNLAHDQNQVVVEDDSIPIRWSIIAASVALLLGFLGGLSWFDWLSRRRHGGIRIY